MDRSKNNQKILLLITALALVVILTFALTACSLFTDAIKGIFSGNTATVNNTDEGGEADPSSSTEQGASGEAGSGTGSGSEDNVPAPARGAAPTQARVPRAAADRVAVAEVQANPSRPPRAIWLPSPPRWFMTKRQERS